MRAFARTTAGFFLFLGIFIIMIGLVIILSSFFGNRSPDISNPGIFINLRGLTGFINIFAGAAIGIQGAFLVAIGQVLWLLTNISEETEQTNRHMLAIFRQIYKPNSNSN